MDTNNIGETSKQKNHDLCDSDRPLKKARYLWQVKGKYHLKDNTRNFTSENMITEDIEENPVNTNKDKENLSIELPMNNNVSQNKNNNSNDVRDRNIVEQLILSTDKILDFPSSPHRNIDKSISDEIPITLVIPRPKNEDFYLRKWQARQIAKGFVDNTINRVLENWMVAPFDATDFVENCDNDGQVEDEGILMAIQSHGLQPGSRLSVNSTGNGSRNPCSPRISNSSECSCSRQRTNLTSNKQVPFHSRPYENMEQEYYENLCVLKDTEPIEPNKVLDPGRSSKEIFEAVHSEDSKENDPTLHITENIQDLVLPNNNYETMHIDDTDFLDAAVSAAIKKKGLSSYNCVDYG